MAVCDDVELVRASIIAYLRQDPQIEVVGVFASGEEIVRRLDPLGTDLLLLDVRMPGRDGPEIVRWLGAMRASLRVVYLTSYPDDVPINDALTGKVAGALSKDLPPEDLLRALHLAAGGTTLLSPRIVQRGSSYAAGTTRLESFASSDREQDVLDLLCRGFTNEQIARRLNRSVSSVKQILSAMTHRAGVASRTELVLYLLDAGYSPRMGG